MRNLKRALSLTLASVMLLGMMVVGSSAASFKDADQISNDTAATVLQELDIMVGDNNGYFMPEKTVTRGEMAVIICKILYGNKLNVTQFVDGSKFTDVPTSHYANGYVNLANQLGIIAGYGNGKFGPDDTITTAQAAVMLTKALGYFKGSEMTGDWSNDALTAVSTATRLKLFEGLKLATHEGLARDNVAQMTFNTIAKAVPVQYNEFFQSYYTDQKNVMAGVVFSYPDTLGYSNFNLVYNPTSTNDDFGRPVIEWGTGTCTGTNVDNEPTGVVIKSSIVKVANEPVLTYTSAKKAKDIFADLGKPGNLANNGKAVCSNNGTGTVPAELPLNNTNSTEIGGKGTLIEVYKDSDNLVTIVVVDTYLVRATADYNSKDEKLSVVVPGNTVTLSDSKIANDDVNVSSFQKDDLILVTGVMENGKLVVKTAELAEVVENVKISAYNTNDYVTAGGTKYEYSAHDGYYKDVTKNDYSLQKSGYNIVLDKSGYVIGIAKYSDEVTLDDILFVKDAAVNGFNMQAKVLYMDGKEETVTVAATAKSTGDFTNTSSNSTKSVQSAGSSLTAVTPGNIVVGCFYEYGVKSNGDYELRQVDSARQGSVAAKGANNKNVDGDKVQPIVDVNKTATDETIFIANDQLYTGTKNAPDVENSPVYYLVGTGSDSKYLLAVYTTESGISVTNTSDFVYILENKGSGKDDNDKSYNVYTAIHEGSKVEYLASGETITTANKGLYEIKTEKDGYPELKAANKVNLNVTTGDVMRTASGVDSRNIGYKSGTISAGSFGLKTNADTVVYVVDVDDKSANSMDASGVDGIDVGTYDVVAIFTSKSDDTVKTLWLAKTSSTQSTPEDLTGTISASDITDKLNNGVNVNVKGTVNENVTLPSGTTTLGTGASIASGKTITVASGATLKVEVNVSANGTIATEAGSTVVLAATAENLPTITGNGTVEIAEDTMISTPGTEGSKDFFGDLLAKIPAIEANEKTLSGSKPAAGSTGNFEVAISAGTAFKGGKVESYDSLHSMKEVAAVTGGGDAVSLHMITIPKSLIEEGSVVKVFFQTAGSSSWTQIKQYTAPADTTAQIFGSGDGKTLTSTHVAEDLSVVLPLSTNVTKVQFQIATPNAG